MATRATIQRVASYLRAHGPLGRMAIRALPDWPIEIGVPRVGRMRIRIRRNRSLWLRHPIEQEWYPLSILSAFVGPSDVVWDVGSNIGLYARILAGPLNARHVVAFEPMSDNLREIRHNVALGPRREAITVMPLALSDRDGDADFQVDDFQSASGALDAVTVGHASAAREALGLPPKVERVTCRTIDALVEAGQLQPPDVLKIDVEGAEAMVLEGGRRFLRDRRPRLVIETHGVEVTKQCLRFLFDLDYAVAGCVPDSWAPGRHMRFDESVLARITDRYDVQFIAAAPEPRTLPDRLDPDRTRLLGTRQTTAER